MARIDALVKSGVVNTEGFYTLGGRLAVDFANSFKRIGREKEGIGNFEDLLTFMKSHHLLHEDEASDLHMFLFQNPGRCQKVVDSLLELRTGFRAVLTDISQGWPVNPEFFSHINDRLASYKSYHKIEPAEEGMDPIMWRKPAPAPMTTATCISSTSRAMAGAAGAPCQPAAIAPR